MIVNPISGIDHPMSWYAVVEDKKTGKRWTYWINGSQHTRQEIADHIAIFYTNVKVIEIQQTTKRPDKVLQRVPPEHFQSFDPSKVQELFDGPQDQPSPLDMPGIGTKPIISIPHFSPPKPLCPPR